MIPVFLDLVFCHYVSVFLHQTFTPGSMKMALEQQVDLHIGKKNSKALFDKSVIQ